MYNTEKNEQIFKIINPNSNDILSKMNRKDLEYLLLNMKKYYLELRDNLSFNKDTTFGIEIEFEMLIFKYFFKKYYSLSIIEKQILKKCHTKAFDKLNLDLKISNNFENIDNYYIDDDKYKHWSFSYDISLNKGAEAISPILNDSPKTWEEINKMCNFLNKYAQADEHTGGHIHIGVQELGSSYDSWLNFIKIWMVYENIIFRFSNGSFLTSRPNLNRYAKPLSKDFHSIFNDLTNLTLKEIVSTINNSKFQAVNFGNAYNYEQIADKNTIEFRCPNGTLNPIIWQNNINFFVKLLNYSKSSAFDTYKIEKRDIINKTLLNYDNYNKIDLDEAIELCDMIFNNNLDKIYFLKQYLKSFQESTNNKFKKAKRFTK